MPIRVGMVSLGCSKNLVDSERMLAKLRAHGYQLVTEPGEADVAIVNTCGFIQSAKEEAIETILELGALKKDGTLKKIILTGCLTLSGRSGGTVHRGRCRYWHRQQSGHRGHSRPRAGWRACRAVRQKERCRNEGRPDHYHPALFCIPENCRGLFQQLYLLCHSCHSRTVPQRTHGGRAGRGTLAGRAPRDGTDRHCTGYHPIRCRSVRQVQAAGTAAGTVPH